MDLYAISDLHLANKSNRQALENLPFYKSDWLILAGDIGETSDLLEYALTILKYKFKQIVWVPGNHDLWTIPQLDNLPKGEKKYKRLVEICRSFNVITPEDKYPTIILNNQNYIIAPTFTLYDYSFRPQEIELEEAVNWSMESGVLCSDEELLFANPYSSIIEWCKFRCEYTEDRLKKIHPNVPIILVNHFPLLELHAKLPRFPRFSIWCGTKFTESWMSAFNIKIVIYGHLHIRSTRYYNNVLYQEVSLGYQGDWDESKGMNCYLKKIS